MILPFIIPRKVLQIYDQFWAIAWICENVHIHTYHIYYICIGTKPSAAAVLADIFIRAWLSFATSSWTVSNQILVICTLEFRNSIHYIENVLISVLGDWKDISIAHVISIIKSEVFTFPIVIVFSVVVCLRRLLHHILSLIAYTSRDNREFVFIIIVQFMMSANIRIRFGLQIVLVCLYSASSHYHHCANLSEGIELIKCLSDIFCRVCG